MSEIIKMNTEQYNNFQLQLIYPLLHIGLWQHPPAVVGLEACSRQAGIINLI